MVSPTPPHDDRQGHHYYTTPFARISCIVVMTLAVIMRPGAGHYPQLSGCCLGPRCKGVLGTAQEGGQGWEVPQEDCSHRVLDDPIEAALRVACGRLVRCEEAITV